MAAAPFGQFIDGKSHCGVGVLHVRGRGMAAAEQRIDCLRELHAGVVAATCTLVGAHLDTVARKSCPLPDEVVAAARALRPQAA